MFLKRRIVLDKNGDALRFDMVLYPDKESYYDDDSEGYDFKGHVIGSTQCYEKAERLEILFNDICN